MDGNDDDALITSLITQAREYCEDYQGKKFITQTLELVLDSFPDKNYIEFKACSPIQSVTSVKYTDSDGTEKTFDSGNYMVDADSFVNCLVLGYKKQWPTDILQPVNGIRIRFIAGYPPGEADAEGNIDYAVNVPESVKWAMVLHMRLFYDDYKPEEQRRLEQARNALLGMNRVIPV